MFAANQWLTALRLNRQAASRAVTHRTEKMNPSKPVHALQQATAVGLIEHRLNARSLPEAHIRRRDIQG